MSMSLILKLKPNSIDRQMQSTSILEVGKNKKRHIHDREHASLDGPRATPIMA